MIHKKNTQLVSLHFVYIHKKNSPGTDITNNDQNTYAFAPTYGDGSTVFHCHMISVVLFFNSNTLLKYVSGLRSYRNGLLWRIFGCCTTFHNNEGKWYYYLSFAHCPMYRFQSNTICYSNTYWQGIVEVTIFNIRFQGY